MGKFQFSDRTIKLDFDGKIYDLSVDGDNRRRIEAMCDKALTEYRAIEKDGGEDEVTDLILDLIDDLLGEGAVDDIFGDREPCIEDGIDILSYITTELMEYNTKNEKKYETSVPAPPVNRAARRAQRRTRK